MTMMRRPRPTGLSDGHVPPASDGGTAEAWLQTGDSYAFTPAASIRAVEETLVGSKGGALSPVVAFGVDFAITIQDTTLMDVQARNP
jgi:hypothetical protein